MGLVHWSAWSFAASYMHVKSGSTVWEIFSYYWSCVWWQYLPDIFAPSCIPLRLVSIVVHLSFLHHFLASNKEKNTDLPLEYPVACCLSLTTSISGRQHVLPECLAFMTSQFCPNGLFNQFSELIEWPFDALRHLVLFWFVFSPPVYTSDKEPWLNLSVMTACLKVMTSMVKSS